jgi:hypothetical protein
MLKYIIMNMLYGVECVTAASIDVIFIVINHQYKL